MNFHVLTLFPDMIKGGLNHSITGRAMERGQISVNTVDIRFCFRAEQGSL